MRSHTSYLPLVATLLVGAILPASAKAATVHRAGLSLTIPQGWTEEEPQTSDLSAGGQLLGTWRSPAGKSPTKVVLASVDAAAAAAARSELALRREITAALQSVPGSSQILEIAHTEIDGVPSYRARFRFGDGGRTIETLYVVHARTTYLFAVITAGADLTTHLSACADIVRRLAVTDEAHWLTGVTRSLSLGFLAFLAGAAWLLRRFSGSLAGGLHETLLPVPVCSQSQPNDDLQAADTARIIGGRESTPCQGQTTEQCGA